MTVTGKWFRSEGLACRFGESMAISAKYLTSTAVACIAPAAEHLLAEAEVELSFNGGADFTEDSKRYIYEQGVTVTQIWPSRTTLTGGGWQPVVTVLGSHFQDREDLSCRYGLNSIVKGGYTSSTSVLCHVPAESVGNISVTVSSNGAEFSWTSAPLVVVAGSNASSTFDGSRSGFGRQEAGGGENRDEETRLTSLWPVAVTAWSATEVNMYGKGFGLHMDACWIGGARSELVLVSSSHAKCHLNPQSPGLVRLEVAERNAGRGAVAGLDIEVTEPLVLDSLSPSHGWLKGDLLTLRGQGFIRSSLLTCQVGETRVSGIWLSSSLTVCAATDDAVRQGSLSVEVSNNGADFTTVGLLFEHALITLHSIVPSQGPARGGTRCAISISSAFRFQQQPVCKFQGTALESMVWCIARHLSTGQGRLRCLS